MYIAEAVILQTILRPIASDLDSRVEPAKFRKILRHFAPDLDFGAGGIKVNDPKNFHQERSLTLSEASQPASENTDDKSLAQKVWIKFSPY